MSCLRRSHLLGALAPRIAAVVASPSPRIAGLLTLDEQELIQAVAGPRADAGRRFLEAFDPDDARAQAASRGVGALCRHAAGYPSGLLDLSDPPSVLYHTGDADRLSELVGAPAVALVGARRASEYGLEVARSLGEALSAAGVTVVSGLALGIDAAAHRGALQGGGRAVAVLACGADVAYPRTNRPLYNRVRERGVVVSELPPGRGVFRWSFPARNRIMASLASITVVVEAAEPSGSLITAQFAEGLHREVGAVPGLVTSRRAEGSNRLLRDGASVVRGAGDVLDALFGAGGWAASAASEPRALLSEVERTVLDGVEVGEGADAIGRRSGLSARTTRAALGRLESLGLVASDGLGGYTRRVPG